MRILIIFLFILVSYCSSKSVTGSEDQKKIVTHEIWDQLLNQYVHIDGLVDYEGIKEDYQKLESYLSLLSSDLPGDNWSREEEMAYWINAYNAFTVKLIVDHMPIKSIKDIKRGIPFINTVWDIKFIIIGGKKYDLNNIEHGILRKKFKDARIHGAVNCASISCPNLRPEAFTAEKLDAQLDEAMTQFINDKSKNQITETHAYLSKIFNWFGGDFKRNEGSVKNFINKYSKVKIVSQKVAYLDYDWNLNKS
jgi:hypothetical protein